MAKRLGHGNTVFSTYVEVILISAAKDAEGLGFLHVCGGDPRDGFTLLAMGLFSPRMWR